MATETVIPESVCLKKDEKEDNALSSEILDEKVIELAVNKVKQIESGHKPLETSSQVAETVYTQLETDKPTHESETFFETLSVPMVKSNASESCEATETLYAGKTNDDEGVEAVSTQTEPKNENIRNEVKYDDKAVIEKEACEETAESEVALELYDNKLSSQKETLEKEQDDNDDVTNSSQNATIVVDFKEQNPIEKPKDFLKEETEDTIHDANEASEVYEKGEDDNSEQKPEKCVKKIEQEEEIEENKPGVEIEENIEQNKLLHDVTADVCISTKTESQVDTTESEKNDDKETEKSDVPLIKEVSKEIGSENAVYHEPEEKENEKKSEVEYEIAEVKEYVEDDAEEIRSSIESTDETKQEKLLYDVPVDVCISTQTEPKEKTAEKVEKNDEMLEEKVSVKPESEEGLKLPESSNEIVSKCKDQDKEQELDVSENIQESGNEITSSQNAPSEDKKETNAVISEENQKREAGDRLVDSKESNQQSENEAKDNNDEKPAEIEEKTEQNELLSDSTANSYIPPQTESQVETTEHVKKDEEDDKKSDIPLFKEATSEETDSKKAEYDETEQDVSKLEEDEKEQDVNTLVEDTEKIGLSIESPEETEKQPLINVIQKDIFMSTKAEPNEETTENVKKNDEEAIENDDGQTNKSGSLVVEKIHEDVISEKAESEEELKLTESFNEIVSKDEDREKEQKLDVSENIQEGGNEITSTQNASSEDKNETSAVIYEESQKKESEDVSVDAQQANQQSENGATDITETIEHEKKDEEEAEKFDIPSFKDVSEETGLKKAEYEETEQEISMLEKEQDDEKEQNVNVLEEDTENVIPTDICVSTKAEPNEETAENVENNDEEANENDVGQTTKSESLMVEKIQEDIVSMKAESEEGLKHPESSNEIGNKDEDQEKEQELNESDKGQRGGDEITSSQNASEVIKELNTVILDENPKEEAEDISIDAQEANLQSENGAKDNSEDKPDEEVKKTQLEEVNENIRPGIEIEETAEQNELVHDSTVNVCIPPQTISQVETTEYEKKDKEEAEKSDIPSFKDVSEETGSKKAEYEETEQEVSMLEKDEGDEKKQDVNSLVEDTEIIIPTDICVSTKTEPDEETMENVEKNDEEVNENDVGQTTKSESLVVEKMHEDVVSEKTESEEVLKHPESSNEIGNKDEDEEKEQKLNVSDKGQRDEDEITSSQYACDDIKETNAVNLDENLKEEAEDRSIDAQEANQQSENGAKDNSEEKSDEVKKMRLGEVNENIRPGVKIEETAEQNELVHNSPVDVCISPQTVSQVETTEYEKKDEKEAEKSDIPSFKDISEETGSKKAEYEETEQKVSMLEKDEDEEQHVSTLEEDTEKIRSSINTPEETEKQPLTNIIPPDICVSTETKPDEEKTENVDIYDKEAHENDDGQTSMSGSLMAEKIHEDVLLKVETEEGLKHPENSEEIVNKYEDQEKKEELHVTNKDQGGSNDITSSQNASDDIKETHDVISDENLKEEAEDRTIEAREANIPYEDGTNEQKPDESVNKTVESVSKLEPEDYTEEYKPSVVPNEEVSVCIATQTEATKDEPKEIETEAEVVEAKESIKEGTKEARSSNEKPEKTEQPIDVYISTQTEIEEKNDEEAVGEISTETVSEKAEPEEGLTSFDENEIVSIDEDEEKEQKFCLPQNASDKDKSETMLGQDVTTEAYFEEGQGLSAMPKEIFKEEAENRSIEAQEVSKQYENRALDNKQKPEESVDKFQESCSKVQQDEYTEEIKPDVDANEEKEEEVTKNEKNDNVGKENSSNSVVEEVCEETELKNAEIEENVKIFDSSNINLDEKTVEILSKDEGKEQELEDATPVSEEDLHEKNYVLESNVREFVETRECVQKAIEKDDEDQQDENEPVVVNSKESEVEDTEEIKSSVETNETTETKPEEETTEKDEKIVKEGTENHDDQTKISEILLVEEVCEPTSSEKAKSEEAVKHSESLSTTLDEDDKVNKEVEVEKDHDLKRSELKGGENDVISSQNVANEEIKETEIGAHATTEAYSEEGHGLSATTEEIIEEEKAEDKSIDSQEMSTEVEQPKQQLVDELQASQMEIIGEKAEDEIPKKDEDLSCDKKEDTYGSTTTEEKIISHGGSESIEERTFSLDEVSEEKIITVSDTTAVEPQEDIKPSKALKTSTNDTSNSEKAKAESENLSIPNLESVSEVQVPEVVHTSEESKVNEEYLISATTLSVDEEKGNVKEDILTDEKTERTTEIKQETFEEACEETNMEINEKAVTTSKDEDQEKGQEVNILIKGQGKDEVTSTHDAAFKEEDLQEKRYESEDGYEDTEKIDSTVKTKESESESSLFKEVEKAESEDVVNHSESSDTKLDENEIVSKEENQEKDEVIPTADVSNETIAVEPKEDIKPSSSLRKLSEDVSDSIKPKAESGNSPIDDIKSASEVQVLEVVPKSEDSKIATYVDEEQGTTTAEISSNEKPEKSHITGENVTQLQLTGENDSSYEIRDLEKDATQESQLNSKDDCSDVVNDVIFTDEVSTQTNEVLVDSEDSRVKEENIVSKTVEYTAETEIEDEPKCKSDEIPSTADTEKKTIIDVNDTTAVEPREDITPSNSNSNSENPKTDLESVSEVPIPEVVHTSDESKVKEESLITATTLPMDEDKGAVKEDILTDEKTVQTTVIKQQTFEEACESQDGFVKSGENVDEDTEKINSNVITEEGESESSFLKEACEATSTEKAKSEEVVKHEEIVNEPVKSCADNVEEIITEAETNSGEDKKVEVKLDEDNQIDRTYDISEIEDEVISTEDVSRETIAVEPKEDIKPSSSLEKSTEDISDSIKPKVESANLPIDLESVSEVQVSEVVSKSIDSDIATCVDEEKGTTTTEISSNELPEKSHITTGENVTQLQLTGENDSSYEIRDLEEDVTQESQLTSTEDSSDVVNDVILTDEISNSDPVFVNTPEVTEDLQMVKDISCESKVINDSVDKASKEKSIPSLEDAATSEPQVDLSNIEATAYPSEREKLPTQALESVCDVQTTEALVDSEDLKVKEESIVLKTVEYTAETESKDELQNKSNVFLSEEAKKSDLNIEETILTKENRELHEKLDTTSESLTENDQVNETTPQPEQSDVSSESIIYDQTLESKSEHTNEKDLEGDVTHAPDTQIKGVDETTKTIILTDEVEVETEKNNESNEVKGQISEKDHATTDEVDNASTSNQKELANEIELSKLVPGENTEVTELRAESEIKPENMQVAEDSTLSSGVSNEKLLYVTEVSDAKEDMVVKAEVAEKVTDESCNDAVAEVTVHERFEQTKEVLLEDETAEENKSIKDDKNEDIVCSKLTSAENEVSQQIERSSSISDELLETKVPVKDTMAANLQASAVVEYVPEGEEASTISTSNLPEASTKMPPAKHEPEITTTTEDIEDETKDKEVVSLPVEKTETLQVSTIISKIDENEQNDSCDMLNKDNEALQPQEHISGLEVVDPPKTIEPPHLDTKQATSELVDQESQKEQKKEADENIEAANSIGNVRNLTMEPELKSVNFEDPSVVDPNNMTDDTYEAVEGVVKEDQPLKSTCDTVMKQEPLDVDSPVTLDKYATDDLLKNSQTRPNKPVYQVSTRSVYKQSPNEPLEIESKLLTENVDTVESTAKSMTADVEENKVTQTSTTEPQNSSIVLKDERKTSDEKEKSEAAEPTNQLSTDKLQERTQETSEVVNVTEDNQTLQIKDQQVVKEENDECEVKTDDENEGEVLVEASKDMEEVKVPKKSHNILSGVGSKVKHSLAKVKKAITGKSTHPKPPSPTKKDSVIT
ncbi:uncharacterized protein [Rutidosis leptorrhynchoides]|uniref:uncharacterized protein n=1 Tax=Rutidosis leptorrhynchoides TaxID=125765 RepID=UPI003A998506